MVDFKKIEKKWQKRWEKAKLFEANPDREKKKYFITVPYPYTSGTLHVGHGRTYTIGDITARFLRMNGLNVLWPIAWHVTGTPIIAISKRISDGDKGVIQDHLSYIKLHNPKDAKKIIKTFTEPENVANYYAGVIGKDLKELGCSIDWRREFNTNEAIYNQFVRWQYHHLNSLGYLKRGEHPVFYCKTCDNPVTTDDVKSGDELKMSIGEFFLLKEPFKDGYIVAATLRPETIFGVVNVWVNPNATYVKARVENEVWYISERAAEKLKDQNLQVNILQKFRGENLIGKEVFIPLTDRKVLILPAFFVEDDVATGVVNSVPAHAPIDYTALEDLKKDSVARRVFDLSLDTIEKIKPVGIISVEGFSEFPAIDVVNEMKIKSQKEITKLEKATQEVYSAEFYNGILKENCGDLVGVKVSEAKEKVYEKLIKGNLATKMFESMVKDLDGKIVKKVFCRDGTEVVIKILKDQWFLDYGDEAWKLQTKNLLSKMQILPEVYRKQFEDSIEWLHEWACARNRGLGTRLPYDERWLIESLSDSTIYMALYTIVHFIRKYRIKSGQLTRELFDYVFLGIGNIGKISHDTGIKPNILKRMKEEFLYWYPLDERRTAIMHIANHLSFFLFHHAVIFPETLWPKKISLNEPVIVEGKKMSKSSGNVIPLTFVIRKYGADVVRLYLMNVADIQSTLDWKEKEIELTKKKLIRFVEIFNSTFKNKQKKVKSLVGKWLIAKFYENLREATKKFKDYQFKQYVQKIFFETLNEIEYYNLRKIKNENATYEILKDWILSLSPLMPHLSEEFWHKMGKRNFISLEKWPKIKEVDKKILELENIFRNSLEDLRQVIKLAGEKQKVYLYFVSPHEIEYFNEAKDYLKLQFNFKEVFIFNSSDPKRYDPQNKASKAKYGKPGIYLE